MRFERSSGAIGTARRLLPWSADKALVPVLLAFGIAAAFLREILFAQYFGTSYEIEVFRLAYSIPNLLSQSVAPAFLGAVVPLLVLEDRERGGAISATEKGVISISIVGAAVIAVAGIALSLPLAATLAPGFDESQLAYLATQIRTSWLFFWIVSTSFGVRAILNTRAVFWPSASAALIISTTFVAGCSFAATLRDDMDWTAGFLVNTALVAAALVLASHLVHKDNVAIAYVRSIRDRSGDHAAVYRAIVTALVSVVSFKVAFAIPRVIDRAFASELGPGSVAALDYSFGLLSVPGILLATTLITVAYPGFSRQVSGTFHVASLRKFGVALIAAFALASLTGILIFAFAPGLVQLVYERGSFDQTAARMTAELLRWHGLGLGFMVASLVLAQALFAFRAYLLALVLVAVRVVSKVIAVQVLVPRFGLQGLGASFIVPEVVTCAASCIVLFALITRASSD